MMFEKMVCALWVIYSELCNEKRERERREGQVGGAAYGHFKEEGHLVLSQMRLY